MGGREWQSRACAGGTRRASFVAMNATATTAQPLTVEERKARLAALVKAGKVSPEQAKMIVITDGVTDRDRAIAATLMDKAAAALARHGGCAA